VIDGASAKAYPEKAMQVVFTDLDGTLLDERTYSWDAARPALERLERLGAPWVFVTSKTRAEVLPLRRRLGNRHPFVVENGGAACVPHGYFPFTAPSALERDGYEVLEWGTRYGDLVAGLKAAVKASGCQVAAFHAMSVQEVAAASGLPLEEAALAKEREYDEPFEILDERCTRRLLAAVKEQGLRWTRGGRFHHVCGNNDKAVAVRALVQLFAKVHGQLTSIGLGDGLNDVPFLQVVDVPVLIRSRALAALKKAVPRGIPTRQPGPEGWNDALLELIRER